MTQVPISRRGVDPLGGDEPLAQAPQPGHAATEGEQEHGAENEPVQDGVELSFGQFHRSLPS
jgi:hypothetical protein